MLNAVDYLKLLRRVWWQLALVAVIGAALGFAVSQLRTPEYTSSTQLFVSAQAGSSANDLLQGSSFAQQQVKSYGDVATSRAVLGPVAERFRVPGGAGELAKQVDATVALDTVLVKISVTAQQPDRGQAIANAIGRQFIAVVAGLELPRAGGAPSVRATVIDPAVAPTAPSSPNPKLDVLLGAVIALLLGWLLAVGRELLDTRVRNADSAKELIGAPLLGSLPKARDATDLARETVLHPTSTVTEAYRQMRTNLRFLHVDRTLRRIVVTSCVPGEGKSTVATNLASSLAEAGASVVLVEADLRRPTQAKYQGLQPHVGLTSVLSGAVELDDALQRREPGGPAVLVAGPVPPNPSELIESHRMAHLLDELGDRFDYVLLDCPPLLPVADAAVLSVRADGTLMVVRHATTKRGQLQQAHNQLEQVGARVLGLVYNAAPQSGSDAYGYYGGYSSDAPTAAPGNADGERLPVAAR